MADVRLSARHLDEVVIILRTHLPADVGVDVFGSRATGLGVKPHSDLDLLLTAADDLPLHVLRELRDAFAESNLPFRVDLLQRRDAGPVFLASIERAGLVALSVPALTP